MLADMYENQDPVHQLVHLYVDGGFDRRELIRKVTKLTGSLAAAMAALAGFDELKAQGPPPACPAGIKVPLDAPDVDARDIEWTAAGGIKMFGHLALPKGIREPQPGVIMIHENRGLVEHHKDVTRRLARAGFVALGIDLLSRQGGTSLFPEATDQTAAYGRTNQFDRRVDIIAALDYLKFHPMVVFNRIATVGFCAGGGNVWDLVINVPEIAAAVPFYGAPPPLEDLARLETPVLGIYAERDRALTARMAPVITDLLNRQKGFGLVIYEGVGHAFHNDTGAAYDPASACDAWSRTIAYFNRWLRRP